MIGWVQVIFLGDGVALAYDIVLQAMNRSIYIFLTTNNLYRIPLIYI